MKTYQGYGGAIDLFDDHLVISREGKLAKAAGLGETREIPLAGIGYVTLKPATRMVNGYIQLQLGNDPPRDHRGDPNSVLFRHKYQKDFAELAEHLQQRISENRDAGIDPGSVEVDRGSSRTDELRARSEQARAAGPARDSFAGIALRGDRIESSQGGGSIDGARATIDTAGALESRMTATRLVLTGPLALAWRKKKDTRELYLLVEGAGWAISVPVDPKKGAEARAFAAKINAAGSSRAAQPSPAASEPSVPVAGDVLDQIRKLGELRDAGVLTEEEFNTKKADLLKRV